jgi:hypothetical protein
VAGKLPPTILKLVPEIATEFTFSTDVPLDVNVSARVAAEFTDVLPKFRSLALMLS